MLAGAENRCTRAEKRCCWSREEVLLEQQRRGATKAEKRCHWSTEEGQVFNRANTRCYFDSKVCCLSGGKVS